MDRDAHPFVLAWRKDGEFATHVRRTEGRLQPGTAIRINPVILKDVWAGPTHASTYPLPAPPPPPGRRDDTGFRRYDPNLLVVDCDNSQFRAVPLHLLRDHFHLFQWMHLGVRTELFEMFSEMRACIISNIIVDSIQIHHFEWYTACACTKCDGYLELEDTCPFCGTEGKLRTKPRRFLPSPTFGVSPLWRRLSWKNPHRPVQNVENIQTSPQFSDFKPYI